MNIELTLIELRLLADWASMVQGEWGFAEPEETPLLLRLSDLHERSHEHQWAEETQRPRDIHPSVFLERCGLCRRTRSTVQWPK